MNVYIESIGFFENEGAKNRKLVMVLSNGTTVRACVCQESWEQWGGTTDDLFVTLRTVEKYNDWLHGGDCPE